MGETLSLKLLLLFSTLALSAFFYKKQQQEIRPRKENISNASQEENLKDINVLSKNSVNENTVEKKSSVNFVNLKTDSSPQPSDLIFKGIPVSNTKNPQDFSANWKWQDTDLPRDLILPFFEKKQAEQIVYFSEAGTQTLRPTKYESFDKQDGQTLFVGTTESVKKTADERVASSDKLSHKNEDPNKANDSAKDNTLDDTNSSNQDNNVSTDNNNKDDVKKEKSVAENDFEVVFFHPGKRDDGSTLTCFLYH